MKENNLKGVWTKFLAVLIAVAMVIPLAFSGWASNRVYAEEGDSSGTGTSQAISDADAHQIKTNEDFFSSRLALDSNILEDGFEVTVTKAGSTTQRAKGYSLAYFGKDVPRIDNDNKIYNDKNVWFSDDAYIDMAFGDDITPNPRRYSRFYSEKTGEIPAYSIAFATEEAARNSQINIKYPQIGIYDGKPIGMEVVIENIQPELRPITQQLVNLAESLPKQDEIDKIPASIRDEIIDWVGADHIAKVAQSQKDGETHYHVVCDNGRDSEGWYYEYDPDKGWAQINRSGNNTVVKHRDGATVNNDSAYHGYYQTEDTVFGGWNAGVKPAIDANTNARTTQNTVSKLMLYSGFQIAAKPEGGIHQENVHSADYRVKFFYADTPSNQDENIVNTYIAETDDIYLTLSSLSYGAAPSAAYTGNYNQPHNVPMGTPAQSNNNYITIEKARPLTPIKAGFITDNSNILTSFEHTTSTSDDKDQYYDVASGKAIGIKDQDTYSDSTNWYTPFTGEWKVNGIGDKRGKDAENAVIEVEGQEGRPNSVDDGSWNSDNYEDEIGHETFTSNAVSLLYESSDNIGFATGSNGNSMWFTIYPQGLTNMTPADPAVSSDDDPTKSVYPNLENTEIPASAGYRAGETIKYLVTQQANELSYNSIVRYNSFSITDTVPEGTTLQDSGRRVYYIGEKAQLDADGAAITDEDGNPVMETTEIDVTNKGSFSVDGKKLTFTFNEDYLHNEMPMRGEIYYMTLETKVNSGLAEGTELVNTVDTNINGTSFPDRTKPENENVGKTTAKVITQEVKYEERLTDRDQEFVYVISQAVPADATSIEITDEIDDLLQVVGTPRLVYIGDEDGDGQTEEIDVAGAKVTIEPPSSSLSATDGVKQLVTASVMDGVTSEQKYVSNIRGKMIALKIVAKIRPDVTDEQLLAKDLNRIPNKADVKFNNKSKTTNEVDVVPPYEVEKSVFVNNSDGKNYNKEGHEEKTFISKGESKTVHANAVTPEDTFTYRITYPVPSDATDVRFIDYLDRKADSAGEGSDPEGSGGAEGMLVMSVTDGKPGVRIYKDDDFNNPVVTFDTVKDGAKSLVFSLTNDNGKLTELRGHIMTIEFDVKFDPTKSMEEIMAVYGRVPEDTDYVHEGVQNTAALKFNNYDWLKSNTVTVTATPEKQVNGNNQKIDSSAEVLETRDEVFTYTVTDKVPLNADRVIMSDTLNEVLELYANEARASEGGKWRANNSLANAARVIANVNGADVTLEYNTDYKTVVGVSPEGQNTITVTLTPAGLEKIKPAVGKEGTPEVVNRTETPNDPETYQKMETLINMLDEGVTLVAAARGPNTIFVETSDGKYYKSDNEGATWTECTAQNDLNFAKGCIAGDHAYANNTILDISINVTEEVIPGVPAVENKETTIKFEFDAIIKRAPDGKLDDSAVATAEDLQPYILGDGIPNTASVDFNGTPRVTNEVNVTPPNLGDLTISKSVAPRSGAFTDKELNEEFTFVVTLTAEKTPGDKDSRENLSGEFELELTTTEGMESQLENITLTDDIKKDGDTYKITFTDGKASINLKHGVIANIKGLPAEAIVEYVIEENPSTNFRQQEATSDSGTIQNGVPVEADFTNIETEGAKKFVSREDGANEGEHIAIGMEEIYRYKVQDNIVSNAKVVKVQDTLEDVLALVMDDNHKIKAYYVENGEEVEVEFEVTKGADGEKDLEITIADNGNGLSQAAGRTLTVEFFARIAEGTTPEQLAAYYVTPSDDEDVQAALDKNYIPNKGTFDIDNTARVTNQVTVKPPVDEPEKTISADGEEFDIEKVKLTNRDDVFWYQISQLVPAVITENGQDVEVTQIEFTDSLETVLTYADAEGNPSTAVENVKITADGEEVAQGENVVVTISGQNLTVTISGDAMDDIRNKFVKVTFPAVIKEGITDEDLLIAYGGVTDIPNAATVKINNTGNTTPKVYVTPPPTPEKRVNNDVHYALSEEEFNADKTFTYEVRQFIPADAATVEFFDNLDPMLDFAGTYTVKAGSETIKSGDVDPKAEILSFTLSADELEQAQGKTLVVTFDAKYDVKNVDTIIGQDNYKVVITDNGAVESGITEHNGTPNYATIKIDPDNDGKSSNTVTVTPPSTEPGNLDVAKTVKPAEGELTDEGNKELADKTFDFEVTFTFDKDATVPETLKFAIADAGTKAADIREADWEDKAVTDGKMTFSLKHGKVAHIKDVPGKTTYKVTETTSSSAGFNVDSFGDEGTVASNVTQTANFVNEQTAPPHPGNLQVNKAFSGDVPSGADQKEFTFTVKFTDHGPVAEKDAQGNEIKVQLNGEDLTDENSKKDANGNVTEITFTVKAGGEAAKITGIPAGTKYEITEAEDPEYTIESSSVNMTGTISADGTATAVAINKYEKPSDDPVKKINGQNHEDLPSKDTEFTYTIEQFIPLGTTTVEFSDSVNGQLEYVGDASVTGGTLNKTVTPAVTPEGKTLLFELDADECKAVEGHIMTVTVKAKYADNVTDETIEGSYVGVIDATEDAQEQIVGADEEADHTGTPNHATTKVGDHEANTNTVTVTAPPDVPNPEKSVGNDADSQEELEKDEEGNVTNKPNLKLAGREDTFTYSVTQELSESLNLKSISFSDKLVDVLEFIPASNANANVVDDAGNDVAVTVNIDGQTITATVDDVNALKDENGKLTVKSLTFTFNAKIRDNVTDDMLRAAGYVNNSIPNTATVNINGSPLGTNEVLVTPPSEEEVPEKMILADSEATADDAEPHKGTSSLKNRDEEFTYYVSQKVPTGAYYLYFEDTIKEVLEFVGDSSAASLAVDGVEVEGAEIEQHTSDRTIVAKVGTDTAPAEGEESPIKDLEGKTVVLTFKAKLKDDVTDEELYGKYVEKSLSVPNEATVKVNDSSLNTNKVYVTPPPKNPEEPEKFVEGEKYGTPAEELKDGEEELPSYNLVKRFAEVTYTVVQKVPAMATNVQFIDQLERVLEVAKVAEGEDAGNYTFAKDDAGNNLKVAVEDKDGNPISKAVVRVIGNLVMATIDDADTLESLTNKDVVLRIAAKLRENVTDQELIDEYGDGREIPNEATVLIGDHSDTTNKVKIVPSEEPEEPVKTVEANGTDKDGNDLADGKKGTTNADKTFATLAARNETFTYKVSQLIPENASSVKFEDTLEDVLEIISTSIDAKSAYNTEGTDGNYVVYNIPEVAEADLGKTVTMTIVAKIKDGIQDEDLVDKYGTTVVPNKADVSIDDRPQTTNKVEVTPPPIESEKPEKKVEGKDEHDLVAEDPNDADSVKAAREKEFEYTITQKVPVGAVRVDFEDTLASVLELYGGEFGGAKIMADVDGTETKIDADFATEEVEVKEREQTSKTIKLTAAVTDKTVLAQLADKTITMSFKAKIKTGVLDSELIEKFGSTRIPNKATVKINGNGKSTDEVYVTPPETPGDSPEKKVEGKKHGTPAADLKEGEKEEPAYKIANRMDEFTYTVSQKLPAEGFTKVVFSDKVEPVLEIVKNSGSVTGADGFVIEYSEDGRTITATKEDASADANAEVTLTFKAKLRAGITDKRLIEDYGEAMEIPNFATVSLDDQPKVTNEVKVTPPPVNREDPTKDVEGIDQDGNVIPATGETEDTVKLTNRKDEFVYTISQEIPAGAVNVVFDDTLERVLHVVGTPEVTVDGTKVDSAAVSVRNNGRIVSATVADATAYADKTMVLTIHAAINEGVTDAQLIALYGDAREIPNEATVTIDGDGKGTNEVKVTPPEEPKDPEKLINDQKEIVTLADREEPFTYTVKQIIPENAKTVTITDTIENELEFVDGSVTFAVDGNVVAGVTPSINGKTITVELTDVQDKELGLKEAVLTFTCMIGEDVTDQQLLDRPNDDKYEKNYNDTTVIPNKAEVKFDFEDDPRTTNTVEVTPPPVPSEEPVKKVDGVDSIKLPEAQIAEDMDAAAKAAAIAEARAKTFTYTVSQKVPAGCVKLEFTDKLEDVLEIVGEPSLDVKGEVTVGEDKLTVNAVVTDKDVLKEGTVVTLTIVAKIKDTVKDSDLIAKYGNTTIPNKATVEINGNPKSTNEVKVTPPDEPGDKPEKTVGADADNQSTETLKLAKRTDTFTYQVKQKLPSELTKVEFKDTVEAVLEIDETSAVITGAKDANAYTITVSDDKRTITAVAEDASADANNEIILTFNAKLKAGITDERLIADYGKAMEIPNQAIVTIDDNPKVTNEVKVTPPPVVREEPKKEVTPDGEGTVDGEKVDAKLMNRKEKFTYTISQAIPAGAVNVQFTDILEHVLETAKDRVKVQVDGKDVEGAQINVVRDRVVTVTVADATAYADKVMVVTINANIKDGVTDEELIKEYGDERQIPNEATVTIDGDGKSTNEVKVTPPEEPEDPVKKINGDVELVTLTDRTKEFEYTVTQKVPENAKTVTITDTLESELEFVGMPTATAGEVSTKGQTVTVEIADATSVRGQEVTLTFKAKIKDSVTDAQLLAREGAYKGTTVVPNTAEVKFDFENDPRSTNTVEVTPPPTPSEEPEKKVGKDAETQSTDTYELTNRSDVFTYTVSQKIPAGAVNVVFEDTLEDVLEFSGTPSLTLSNGDVIAEGPAECFVVDGQKITATIADATAYADDTITFTFSAVIKDSVTDKELIKKYKSTLIPNKATVKINGNPKSTNEVKVTPPPTPGASPEKKVNGQKETYELGSIRDTFEYTVTQKIPDDADTVEFSDTVENVLEIVGGVDGDEARFGKLTYADGTALEDTVDYKITWGETTQTILATIGDATAVRGKELMLTFTAKIKKDVTREQLVQLYGVAAEIPNTAVVTINDNPKASNTVKVTPPPSNTEDPEKKVNGKEHQELENRDDTFTYTVSQKIPDGAVNVKFEDTLERVLEFSDDEKFASLTFSDGKALPEDVEYKIDLSSDAQTVTATIEDATDLAGKTVTLTIYAKIKDDVTDAQLITLYGSTEVPNKATVTIDGKGKSTNEVKVTPPPADREEPEKTVDNAQSKTLANRSDTFTYRVSQKIPANATSAAFTDPIDDFLEVVSAQITGSEDASKYVVTKAQTVTAVAEDVTADRGRTVTLEIVAKIKSTVSDADIIAKYGSAKNIPNKANVEIDGEGMSTNEVIVTPPDTPGDKPEKKVNGVEHVDLANRNEVFEYTVTQKIPEGAEKVVISDTLERFLEATECTFSVEGIEPAVSGQTIAVTIDDASADGLAGQTVVLTIKAKIRDNVTDAELIAQYGTEAAPANKDVPNTAVVTIDGKDTPTNTVTVTPPDEEPGPKGSVIVRHITTDGKVLKDWEDVQRDAEPGTEYTTSVDTFDGYTFVKLNEGSAAADGVVVADKTLEVVYVYAPNGSVRVKHVTTDGTVLKDWEFVQENQPGGTAYETTVGTFEGYEFFKMDDNSAGRTGVVINGKTLDVIYIYNKENEPPSPEPGSVIVRYITDKGEILEDWTDVVRDGEPGTAYTTEQKGFEGYTFLEVPAYSDDVTGTVEANTTKQVTYVYTQNGSVIVRHIATDGTVLADWADVVRNAAPGTGYTTSVGEFEGYTFREVPSYSAGTEGSVEAGKTLEVTYVYEKTPSAPEPPITKKVNGLDHYDLKRVFEPYTYTVTTNIPKDAVNFVVTDKLEPVIEFVSAAEEVSVRVNGQIIGGAAAIAGQTLTVTIPEDVVKTNPDAEVVIEFSARLREGANINAYMETTESPALIPNTAEYSYTDTQDIAHGKPSNEVTVTPPTRDPLPEPPVIPELKKFVNDDPNHADLTIRNEIFKYTLNTKISKNAVSFVITDTLVDELEFAGDKGDVKVTIGGTDVTGELAKCEVSGQTLTIELAYDHLVQREGQEVVVTFNAKIRDDVGEDVLIEKYGEISGKDEHGNDVMLPHIPNEASITLNNDGGAHAIKSNIVTVTPPSREIKKLGLSVSKRILGGNDELAGAKLAIYYREADGSYVEIAIPAWTSGTEAHLVELTDGEYVLVETEAPEGYEISGPIHFRISGNGSVLEVLENGNWVAPKELNTIIMYDAKKQTPPTPTPTPTPGEGEEKKDAPVTPTPPTTPPGTPTTNPPGTPVTTRRVVTPSTSTATRATSTGDANSTTLWIVLAAIAAAAAAGAAVMVRRRRREDD